MSMIELLTVGAIEMPAKTVATMPSAVGCKGRIAYVENGKDGNPTLAISNGTIWVLASDGTTEISSS